MVWPLSEKRQEIQQPQVSQKRTPFPQHGRFPFPSATYKRTDQPNDLGGDGKGFFCPHRKTRFMLLIENVEQVYRKILRK